MSDKPKSIIDDAEAIARRLREIQRETAPMPTPTPQRYWCDDAGEEIDAGEVAFLLPDVPICRACRCIVHPSCATCENSGWVYSSYQATSAPNFVECPDCHNPLGKDSP